eukprot:3374650-Pyramimonas_sp.AAC.1
MCCDGHAELHMLPSANVSAHTYLPSSRSCLRAHDVRDARNWARDSSQSISTEPSESSNKMCRIFPPTSHIVSPTSNSFRASKSFWN